LLLGLVAIGILLLLLCCLAVLAALEHWLGECRGSGRISPAVLGCESLIIAKVHEQTLIVLLVVVHRGEWLTSARK
jgi:hypothetical protein